MWSHRKRHLATASARGQKSKKTTQKGLPPKMSLSHKTPILARTKRSRGESSAGSVVLDLKVTVDREGTQVIRVRRGVTTVSTIQRQWWELSHGRTRAEHGSGQRYSRNHTLQHPVADKTRHTISGKGAETGRGNLWRTNEQGVSSNHTPKGPHGHRNSQPKPMDSCFGVVGAGYA
jgi:hypothetical protein